MSGKLATIYIWVCIGISALGIGVMLLCGNQDRDYGNQLPGHADTVAGDAEEQNRELYIQDESESENFLRLFLPESVKQQDISAKNDYINRKIEITILKTAESELLSGTYFYENPMQGNVYMEEVSLSEEEDRIILALQMHTVFEWENKYEKTEEGNCMSFRFVRPKDKYEKIVVLDAGHGGTDEGFTVSGEDEGPVLKEKDIALAVVKQAGAELVKNDVQVYYTRTDDSNPTAEERVELANMVQADMLISVHGDSSDDTGLYGMRTIYNSSYFIPDFGSVDLAYLLLEKVAASTNEKAIGFEKDTGNIYLIQNAMVPVAQINVGYLSNKQEQKLLQKEDYILRIAEGITEAALAGYKEIQK